MAIFFIATSPALALLSRLTEWHADRKQASLSPKIDINPIPCSNVTHSYSRDILEAFRAKNRGDVSKPQAPRHRPGHPPII